ncbi:MAG: hypothetical protein M3Q64_01065 [bacterium]|nr:hypothetical protein [bacterium]
MDQEKQQELFEEKYQSKLGISYEEWLLSAPTTEDEAYDRCAEIDAELKRTYDTWFDAQGEEKDTMEDYRDKLKLEYDLTEEMFGLELSDR